MNTWRAHDGRFGVLSNNGKSEGFLFLFFLKKEGNEKLMKNEVIIIHTKQMLPENAGAGEGGGGINWRV